MNRNELAFAGFFMGEGMIRISFETRKGRKPFARQVVRITLRQDDEPVLDWILTNFGGHIFRRGVREKVYNRQRGTYTFSNPVTIWQAEDLYTCEKICKLLLKSPVPCKKKLEAQVLIEYAKFKREMWVVGIGYKAGAREKFKEYHDKLIELKKFKELNKQQH